MTRPLPVDEVYRAGAVKEYKRERSLIEHQFLLEQLLDKNQLTKRVLAEFKYADIPFSIVMKRNRIPENFGFAVLVQMTFRKKCDVPTIIGALRHHFKDDDNPDQATADMLMQCARADLVCYSTQTKQFTMMFGISDDVQAEIDRFQFPLPMVVQPRELRTNKDTGYFLGRGSVILRDNYTDDDICLDHLNRLNSVEFVINHDVLGTIQNEWKNINSMKPGETRSEFDKRRRAFDKFDRTANDVIGMLTQLSEKHYLTHKYDKRGRTYCVGYHINYQGNSWNKAITEFAQKELVV